MKTSSIKTKTRMILLSAIILGLPLASAVAQPPPLINYQGRLVDGTNLVSGVVNMRFRLHDDPAGGSLLFESTSLVTVVDGLYSTIIGQNTVSGNLTDALANPAVWLELEVDGTILSPRERILSVGYALMADGVKPEGVTEAMLVNGTVTAAKVDAATFNQTFWQAGGNAGTTGTHYLGTSDDQPLQLHVDGVRVLRLEPDAASPRIVGGHPANTASGSGSTVGGGGNSSDPNSASADYATVSGGIGNTALGTVATVGGGLNNTASGSSSTVGGGWDNTAGDYVATVGGGRNNTASGSRSTVGGGEGNTANALFSTVSGGVNNTVSASRSTVGGGLNNTASAVYSTIGGGWDNTASGQNSTVGGGRNNIASGHYSTVGGGFDNTASGWLSTIPGGRLNFVRDYAFAAGHRAKANHNGAFVWGDSTDDDVASGLNNQVTFRASGGYRLFSNAGLTAGATMGPGLSSWSTLSDRDAKENFEAIDAAAILQRLADLPLTSWNYKADPERRRFIGPTAQDFHDAFDLGERSTINTLDADGVLFSAVQGLYHQNQELKKDNETLRAELELIKSHLGL